MQVCLFEFKKKLCALSVITLRLMRTKKTHTGSVKTGLPMEVESHRSTVGRGKKTEYLGFAKLLVFLLLLSVD